jgi:hypothetical protein
MSLLPLRDVDHVDLHLRCRVARTDWASIDQREHRVNRVKCAGVLNGAPRRDRAQHEADQGPRVAPPRNRFLSSQGIKAYTIDAAWQYGLEHQLGSIEPGKNADLVILSDDPLAMENNPTP